MKFSLGKFNIKSNQLFEINIRLVYSDSVKNNISTAKVITLLTDMRERMRGSSLMTLGTPFELELKDELRGISKLMADIPVTYKVYESVDGKSSIVKNMQLSGEFKDELSSDIYLSKDMLVVLEEFADKVNHFSFLSKNIPYELFVSEMLNSNISTVALVNEILRLNVTLRPGESIEIDSGGFTVFKGEENILHLHKGDWIKAHRENVGIDVESGTGGDLTGTISYMERYLW